MEYLRFSFSETKICHGFVMARRSGRVGIQGVVLRTRAEESDTFIRVEAVSPQTPTRYLGAFKEGGPAVSWEMDVSRRRPWSGSVLCRVDGVGSTLAARARSSLRLQISRTYLAVSGSDARER